MPRRSELQGVANCLVEQISSRNNDFSGYWAIGQLCLYAESEQTNTIYINLREPYNAQIKNTLEGISFNCGGYLKKQLEKREIPECWVIEAGLSVTFNENKNAQHTEWGRVVQKYLCELVLVSDVGHNYISSASGSCVSHTPEKEQRRRNGF